MLIEHILVEKYGIESQGSNYFLVQKTGLLVLPENKKWKLIQLPLLY